MSSIDEPVSVSAYQASWSMEFTDEQQRITAALDIAFADLEHIGSTAVPGLSAKPVIDMMLGVSTFPPPPSLLRSVEQLGYESLGEAGVAGRLYFRMRNPRQMNLHVVRKGGEHWINNLLLRDYLRNNATACQRYTRTKQAVIAAGITTLLDYSAAKVDTINSLLQEAHLASGKHA